MHQESRANGKPQVPLQLASVVYLAEVAFAASATTGASVVYLVRVAFHGSWRSWIRCCPPQSQLASHEELSHIFHTVVLPLKKKKKRGNMTALSLWHGHHYQHGAVVEQLGVCLYDHADAMGSWLAE